MTREEQLLEATVRRMQSLYEYSFLPHGTVEAGEQQPQANTQANTQATAPGTPAPGTPASGTPAPGADMNGDGMPDPMGGQAPGADMNGDGMPDPMGGQAPGADMNGDGMSDPMGGQAPGADMNGDGMSDPMGGMPPMGGAPAGADPMGGQAPGADMNGDGMPDPMGGDQMDMDPSNDTPGPNDNVIEISQLTDTQAEMQQAQTEQSEKLDDVDHKLVNIMKVLDKFTQVLDANDEKISDLKRELQKRTPTEEETMNVRLHAGGNPFEERPNEFWDKFKDINNHYNITANNDAPQYQIRKSDIDHINDRSVYDNFDEIPGSLKEYFTR